MCFWCRTHDPRALDRRLRYFGIILLFAIGAGIGSRSTALLGGRAIWFCCGFLLVSFALMFIREEIDEHPELQQEAKAIAEEKNTDKEILKQEEKAFRKDLEKDIKKDIKEEIEDRILKK